MSGEEHGQEINEALDSRINQLRRAIAEHEATLKGMMLTHDTFYEFRKSDNCNEFDQEPVTSRWYVGMIKQQNSWRLCHGFERNRLTANNDGIQWKTLADCSVEEQLAACLHIEKLKQRIAKNRNP